MVSQNQTDVPRQPRDALWRVVSDFDCHDGNEAVDSGKAVFLDGEVVVDAVCQSGQGKHQQESHNNCARVDVEINYGPDELARRPEMYFVDVRYVKLRTRVSTRLRASSRKKPVLTC